MKTLAALVFCVGTAGVAMGADGQCMFGGKFYSPGAIACNEGAQQECTVGGWKTTGLGCAQNDGRVMPGVQTRGATGVTPPKQPGGPRQPTAQQPPAP